MIATADKDGTGTLDLIEFLQMMKEKIRDQNKEEEITEAFKVFDIVRIDYVSVNLYSNFPINITRTAMATSTGESWG